jgi:hypothetical protein
LRDEEIRWKFDWEVREGRWNLVDESRIGAFWGCVRVLIRKDEKTR